MKKLTLLFAVAFAVVGSAMAQMAIPGEVFAGNSSRFNGRKVTVKNIEIVKSSAALAGPAISGPVNTVNAAPGPVGTPSAPVTHPCRPPRGFTEVGVFFKGMPEYKGCFFMADNMYNQLMRECAHENTPAQITFRGDSRIGYMVSFYRLGM